MNKRIKELAEQATTIEVIDGRGFDETQYTKRFSTKKFAELLITECASIAYKSCDQGDIAAQSILYEFNIDNAQQQK